MLGVDCTAKPTSDFGNKEFKITDVLSNLGVKETDNLGNSTIKTIRSHDGTLNSAGIQTL